jgi:hypothetical protein
MADSATGLRAVGEADHFRICPTQAGKALYPLEEIPLLCLLAVSLPEAQPVTASREAATKPATTTVPHNAGKAANRHGLITHRRPSPKMRRTAKRETVDFFSNPDTFTQEEDSTPPSFSERCCPNATARRPARDFPTPLSSSA